MEELHRISKEGSKIVIYVPHFSNSASSTHITHFRQFGLGTFSPICDNILGWEKYITKKFNLIERVLKIPRRYFFCHFLSEGFYESYVCRIFPAHDIKFVLEIIK